MSVKFLYTTVPGRVLLKIINGTKILTLGEWFVKKPWSAALIGPFIRHNHIDMKDFEGVKFGSYAEFFARKKDRTEFDRNPDVLISPCDSMLSIFPIEKDTLLDIKGSHYEISDLIPDHEVAEKFAEGVCFIFRLQASDYHHFCYIDDCYHGEAHLIPGLLHSVQPIACEKVPVYRLNRRNWSLMETVNFGLVAQIEVGALLVGGIVHEKNRRNAKKGEEMGHFELAGSTVVLLFQKEVKESMGILAKYRDAIGGKREIQVRQGQAIGAIRI